MNSNENRPVSESKKPWQPLERSYVGNVGDVVRGGGGKLSPSTSDPGDANKPQGQG